MKIKDLIWVISGVISVTESVACVSGVWKEMGRELRALEKRERRASGVYGLFRFSYLPESERDVKIIIWYLNLIGWSQHHAIWDFLLVKNRWKLTFIAAFLQTLNSFHKLGTRRCNLATNGVEPGPLWWKVSALSTAPSLLPELMYD